MHYRIRWLNNMAPNNDVPPAYQVVGNGVPKEDDPSWREWAIATKIQINLYYNQINELEKCTKELKDKVHALELQIVGISKDDPDVVVNTTVTTTATANEADNSEPWYNKIPGLLKEYAPYIIAAGAVVFAFFDKIF